MKNLTKTKWFILLSTIVAVSAFLPWISSPFGSINGFAGGQGDGIITLILSIIIGFTSFFSVNQKLIKYLTIIGGSLIFAIAAYPIITIGSFIGLGLYLTAIAGASIVAVNFIKSIKH
jgi:hypothetical protein